MKKILFITALSIVLSTASAQNKVDFEIGDGLSDTSLKTRVERQVSNLLTAINVAEASGSYVNFSGIDIDDMASHSIAMLWENVHFRTLDDEIVTNCLRLGGGQSSGWQVRNIEMEMKPLDDTYTGNKIQEVSIDFDKSGRIVDFNFTLGINQYMRIMKEGVELDDLDRRMQILHYVEQFRNAYNQRILILWMRFSVKMLSSSQGRSSDVCPTSYRSAPQGLRYSTPSKASSNISPT